MHELLMTYNRLLKNQCARYKKEYFEKRGISDPSIAEIKKMRMALNNKFKKETKQLNELHQRSVMRVYESSDSIVSRWA